MYGVDSLLDGSAYEVSSISRPVALRATHTGTHSFSKAKNSRSADVPGTVEASRSPTIEHGSDIMDQLGLVELCDDASSQEEVAADLSDPPSDDEAEDSDAEDVFKLDVCESQNLS